MSSLKVSDINLAAKRRLTKKKGLTSMASQISAKYTRNISDGSEVPTQYTRKGIVTELKVT